MSMNLVIVDRPGSVTLRVRSRSLEIDGDRRIPLRLIDSLLIACDATLESKTLVALAGAGIGVVFVRRDKGSILVPAAAKNAEVKMAQYRASLEPLFIAKWIVEEKIRRHARHMQMHGERMDTAEYLRRVFEAGDLDALLGVEGSFARDYFGRFFALFPKALHRGRRSKNPPKDPLNALMSYLYTLFYHLAAVRLTGYGFEPSIGYLHRPFRSHYALASDMTELFRAEMNEWVFRQFAQKGLKASDFTKDRGGVWLRGEARRELWRQIRQLFGEMEPEIERSISELRRRICRDID